MSNKPSSDLILAQSLKSLVKAKNGVEQAFAYLSRNNKDGMITFKQLIAELKKHQLTSASAEKHLITILTKTVKASSTKEQKLNLEHWKSVCSHFGLEPIKERLPETPPQKDSSEPELDSLENLKDFMKDFKQSNEERQESKHLKKTVLSKLLEYKTKVYENVDRVFTFSFMKNQQSSVKKSKDYERKDYDRKEESPAISRKRSTTSGVSRSTLPTQNFTSLTTRHNSKPYDIDQFWNEARRKSLLSSEYKVKKQPECKSIANPRVKKLKASFEDAVNNPRKSLLSSKLLKWDI